LGEYGSIDPAMVHNPFHLEGFEATFMSTIQARAPGRVKLTVKEFARIQDTGLFEGRHVQLLDGELYEVTKNPPHNFAVSALADALRLLLPRHEYSIREDKSIEPWDYWWPEPDVVVARGPQRRYENRHPGTDDLSLVVEISDTSEQDWTKKLAGYAAAGIAVYCILDLTQRRLEVYRDPTPAGFSFEQILREGELIEVVIDDRSFGRIAVSDLLPQAT
jgi:Uma2 family endonuclease